MKLLKRIIYTLLGVLLAGAVGLVGIILYAEYTGRRFDPADTAVMAAVDLSDGESRLVYDENGNLAELPEGAPQDTAETETAQETSASAGDNSTNAPDDGSVQDAGAVPAVADAAGSGTGDGLEHSYVMDKGSNLFHTSDCPYAANIAAENRAEMTTTRDKIADAGYQPCSNCNP